MQLQQLQQKNDRAKNETKFRNFRNIPSALSSFFPVSTSPASSFNGTQSALESCIRELDGISDASIVDKYAIASPQLKIGFTSSSLLCSPHAAALDSSSAGQNNILTGGASSALEASPTFNAFDNIIPSSPRVLQASPAAASKLSPSSYALLQPHRAALARKSEGLNESGHRRASSASSASSNTQRNSLLAAHDTSSNKTVSSVHTHSDTDRAVATLGDAMQRLQVLEYLIFLASDFLNLKRTHFSERLQTELKLLGQELRTPRPAQVQHVQQVQQAPSLASSPNARKHDAAEGGGGVTLSVRGGGEGGGDGGGGVNASLMVWQVRIIYM
jgi:hypothetical protein